MAGTEAFSILEEQEFLDNMRDLQKGLAAEFARIATHPLVSSQRLYGLMGGGYLSKNRLPRLNGAITVFQIMAISQQAPN